MFGNLFGTPEKKKTICLQGVHISGNMVFYEMEPADFKTSLEEQRELLDTVLIKINEAIASNEALSGREIYLEFGHHKIRPNDFSSLSLLDKE